MSTQGDFDLSSLKIDTGVLRLRPYIKGRKAKPLQAEITRELQIEDIFLMNETELGSKTPALQRIRDTHHQIARMLSEGLRGVEISAITGMSMSRISLLQKDPAFQELMAFYSEAQRENWADVQERLATVALEATSELHHRLLDNPEGVKTAELVEISKLSLDRTGHGPQQKIDSRVAIFDARTLQEMKEQIREAERGNVKTITQDSRTTRGANSAGTSLEAGEGPEGSSAPGLGLREKGSEEI